MAYAVPPVGRICSINRGPFGHHHPEPLPMIHRTENGRQAASLNLEGRVKRAPLTHAEAKARRDFFIHQRNLETTRRELAEQAAALRLILAQARDDLGQFIREHPVARQATHARAVRSSLPKETQDEDLRFRKQVWYSSKIFDSGHAPGPLARDIEANLSSIPKDSFHAILEHMRRVCSDDRKQDKGHLAMKKKFDVGIGAAFQRSDYDRIKQYTARTAKSLGEKERKLVCRGYIAYLRGCAA